MKTFLISYRHEGTEWVLELKARDLDDAKARLANMPYARVDGEVIAKVPATFGPIAQLTVMVRNGFSRLLGSQA